MRNTVNNYVEKFKQERRKRRRTYSLLFALALVVTGGIWWQLHSTGIAMINETYCGLEEHTHDESCYEEVLICGLEETEGKSETSEGHTHDESCYETVSTLICGQEASEGHMHDESCYDEEGNLICGLETSEGHTHTDECYEEQEVLNCGQEDTEGVSGTSENHTHTEDCYELQLVCGKEEHKHTIECMSDESADVETADVWTDTLPKDLTGVWADDVVSIALSQVGYTESTKNFTLADDGETRQGYTRYGAWYGNAYGDWDAMFASFCLYYAGVDENVFPEASGAYAWMVELENLGLYADAADYTPVAGDLVFFDTNADSKADRVGIVEKLDVTVNDDGTKIAEKIYVIEGDYAQDEDSGDAVCKVEYQTDDGTIAGYGTLSVVSEANGINAEASGSTETNAKSEEAVARAVSESGSKDFMYEDENVAIQIHAEGTLSAPVVDEGTAEAETEAAAVSAEETGSEAGLTVASLIETDKEETEIDGSADTEETDAEAADTEGSDHIEKADTEEAEEISWDSVTMEVTILDEKSESYALLAEYANELNEENSGLSILEVVSFSFYYDGEEVDASDWTLTAEVTPVVKEESAIALINEDEEESEKETETSDATVTYTLLETADGDVNEADAATVSSEEKELPTLAVSGLSADSVVALLTASNSTADPSFTVQYYAYLDIVNTSENGTLTLIDTSSSGNNSTSAVLPENGKTPQTIGVDLNEDGTIATTTTLTRIYKDTKYNYSESPDLEHFNKLAGNNSYSLKEIWVLDNGVNVDGAKDSDWKVYSENPGSIEFTNNSAEASGTKIYISEDAVIRLVYNTIKSDYTNKANLYDYDISDGTSTWTNDSYYLTDTREKGINSSTNYSGNGTKLAFGNTNTGTGLGTLLWNGAALNAYNGTSASDESRKPGYEGCTFGLVETLSNGKIVYSDGVDAPKLFDDGEAKGKTTYSNQDLVFSKNGDTYTLTAVKGDAEVSGLDKLENPGNYTEIFTNNFWPMDTVDSYATDGHDMAFGNSSRVSERRYKTDTGGTGNFPKSDDGKDHNSYFGMQYSVDFTLDGEYAGPLNYYFFGDDDMWVFLTDPNGNSTLVCDIGGVHSSVGEYVDLWDYIDANATGTYTLSFFYTERGASGSTCYMQFTLPSVTSATTVQDTGDLKVEKKVDSSEADGSEEFEFTLNLVDNHDNKLIDTYYFEIKNANGDLQETGTVTDGSTFKLKNGYYIRVENLPVDTQCTVTETTTGYTTYCTVGSGGLTEGTAGSGSITNGGTLTMKFVNSTPDVEKKVQDSSGNWGDVNTTSIGSNVKFKTTISDVSNVTNLVLHDVLDTGLANPYVSGVVVQDSEGNETSVSDSNYTVIYYVGKNVTADASATDKCSFEISFTNEFLAGLDTSDKLVVYYRATLTEDAEIGTAKGNDNTTQITYGAGSSSEWDTTTTYTFQIDILKYSGDEKLSGAEFVLYYTYKGVQAESSGGETSTKTVTEYAQVNTSTGYLTGWTTVEANATTLTSDRNGEITVMGLDAGTYYLKETKAPDGYTLLSDPVIITVDSAGTVTYTVDGENVNASTTNNHVKVENKPGYELPLTGGTGTYWYTMAGTLLIGGAAYLMYRNLQRRKGERQF